MQWAVIAEQSLGCDLTIRRNRDRRKQRFDKLRLALAQLVPARPAVKPVDGRWIAFLVRSHGPRPSRFALPVKPSRLRCGAGRVCSARATMIGEGNMRSGG